MDTTLLSALRRCDDCGRITDRPAYRSVVENLWVPICSHCHDRRLLAIEQQIHIELARHIIAETRNLLDHGQHYRFDLVDAEETLSHE